MAFSSLPAEHLRRTCNPDELPFSSTADVETTAEVVGQFRAVEAIQFGIGIKRPGFNLFALGPPGTGKHYFVRRFLQATAKDEAVPHDVCYVHNFDEPYEPLAVLLPPSVGRPFRTALEAFAREARDGLSTMFESDEFRVRLRRAEDAARDKRDAALDTLREEAAKADVAIVQTPESLTLAPMAEGRVLDDPAFEELPTERREELEKAIERFRADLESIVQQFPLWDREFRSELRELEQELSRMVIEPIVEEVRGRFADHEAIGAHLDRVQTDIVDNVASMVSALVANGETEQELAQQVTRAFANYHVNLLVDHHKTAGAPVVYESNPTVNNLFGVVEFQPMERGLTTDFSMIRAGALHRARGGYLILDAQRLLQKEWAWDHLVRVLRDGELKLPSDQNPTGAQPPTAGVKPRPIDIDVKVILVGERHLYHALSDSDPDFPQLFKVAVDFEDVLPRDRHGVEACARLVAALVAQESLRPLSAAAVARVIEFASRLAGRQDRLSTRVRRLFDLIREADYWAGTSDHACVEVVDVTKAMMAFEHRHGRIRDQIIDDITSGLLNISTNAEYVGEVNALQVITSGEFDFGAPGRVSATVRLGHGEVLDIERENNLAGPLHAKGVMILEGFLGGRFAGGRPLSLSARVVFEQSYNPIDGDSASLAETCALMSALSDIPIYQGIGVTGSIDQRGRVQAVGGVNAKIEGFFDVCQRQGLTSEQGVIIPRANEINLMLRQDVVDAVEEGRFHVFSVDTIDEALTVLTGREAGEANTWGEYPEGTVNGRVERRLKAMAALAREYGSRSELDS